MGKSSCEKVALILNHLNLSIDVQDKNLKFKMITIKIKMNHKLILDLTPLIDIILLF